jgi:threonine synthase
VILYPRDKVSTIQRKQMTTLGHNVTACEIDGTFDDCQAIVKRALSDQALTNAQALTSANSINIARLMPQMFYYAFTTLRFPHDSPPTYIVPSGNLGNITAALMAHLCGFTTKHLVAACNANATFPDFLRSGVFSARPSLATISNAMDVGAPSNFFRINSLLGSRLESTTISPRSGPAAIFSGYSINDTDTYAVMREYHSRYGYCLDPHTAVGAVALMRHRDSGESHPPFVIAATAHPAKFSSVVQQALGTSPELPAQLANLLDKPEHRIALSRQYEDFTTLIRSSTFLR